MQINKFSTFVKKMQKIEFFYFYRIDFKFELWILQYNLSILLKYLARWCAPSNPTFEIILSWWQKYQKIDFPTEFWNYEKKFGLMACRCAPRIFTARQDNMKLFSLQIFTLYEQNRKLEKNSTKNWFFIFCLKTALFQQQIFFVFFT